MNAPHSPGAVGSLALALLHAWEPERIFVIVTVFIDESGTHDSPVTIFGGWVGRLGQWAGFDPEWRRLLKTYGLSFLHARKMRQSKGEFAGWPTRKKAEFTNQAADIVLRHLEFGFSIILTEADYQEHYVAQHRPTEVMLDSRYGLCFRHCVSLVPRYCAEAFPDRELDIHFVLESGHKNAGDAERIFNLIKKSTEAHEQSVVRTLRTISFADKAEFPGLQAADANAYTTYQGETREPFQTTELPSDGPIMKAAKKQQKVPVFKWQIQAEQLKGFKGFILDEIAEKSARRQRGR